MNFGVVAIIGTGLIGGSIGLGLKERGLVGSIIGVGHRKISINKALKSFSFRCLISCIFIIPAIFQPSIVVVKKTFRYSNVFSTITYTVRNIIMESGINRL